MILIIITILHNITNLFYYQKTKNKQINILFFYKNVIYNFYCQQKIINFYQQHKFYLITHKMILYTPNTTHNCHMIIFILSIYHVEVKIYFIKIIRFSSIIIFYLQPKIYSNVHKLVLYYPNYVYNYHVIIS